MHFWDIGLYHTWGLVKVPAEVLGALEWMTGVREDEQQCPGKLLQPWDLWFISLTSLADKHSF